MGYTRRMQVRGVYRLAEFCATHPPARSWVRSWLAETQGSVWASPQELKYRYPRASILPDNRVIFDVKGNDYRMLTQVAYKMGIVVVKWIGTHGEYNKINWEAAKNEASRR